MDIVKMSSKGQLVIPEGIRKIEKLQPGDRFIPFILKEGILFKKVKMPDFNKLSKDIQKSFKKNKVSAKEISEAITWARK